VSVKDSKYTSIIEAINQFINIDLFKIERKLKQIEKEAEVYTAIFHPIEGFKVSEIKDYLVLAVDGGMATTNLEGISLTFATAHAFSTVCKEYSEEIADAKVIHSGPEEPRITFSTAMRCLEYNVARRAVKDYLEKGEKNIVVLLDGAITFPDEGLRQYTEGTNLGEWYDKYVKAVNSFFDFIYKNRDKVHILSVAKNPVANKYLVGLNNFFKTEFKNRELIENNARIFEELKRKNSQLLNEIVHVTRKIISASKISERYYFSIAVWNSEKVRSVAVDVTNSSRFEIPIRKFLRENNRVFAFYLKAYKFSSPFYVEFPSWDLNRLDDLEKLLVTISLISPKLGYPYPLVYVDYLTRVDQNIKNLVFQSIKEQAIRKLGFKRFRSLFSEKFSRSVHA